jgi:hypothetical protein
MIQYLVQYVAEAHQDDMRQRAERTRRVRQARAALRQGGARGGAPRRAKHGLAPQPQP